MITKKTSQGIISFSVVLIFSIFALVNFITSCMPPQNTGKETVSPEREKAIQDSLKQIWERELLINVSTGQEYHKNKIWRSGIKPFWRAIELDTTKRFPSLYRKLADCYLNVEPPVPDSAEIVYRMGLRMYPEDADLHRRLGWILAGKGESEEAIEQYEKAIEYDGEFAEDYLRVAELYIKVDQPENAIPKLETYLELVPENNEVRELIGRLYEVTGQEDAQIDALEKSLVEDPENTEIMFKLGQIYFKRNEFAKSIEKYQMYLLKKPDDLIALEAMGNAQQNVGKYNDAIKTYKRILAINDQKVKIYCEIATCYKELGQYSTARTQVNTAIRIDPNFGLAYIVRGEIYEAAADKCAQGRPLKFDDKLIYEMAYKEYQRAKQDPSWADLASRRMEYVEPSIPTKGDRFMHQDQTKSKLECHKWIY